MTQAPTALQIDLFRAVEDVHEMTGAMVVLLTDRDGVALAVAGDEDDIPPALRAVLSGQKLAAAGGVRALLEPVVGELAASPLNYSVLAVDEERVLAIVFDSEANLETVQTVGREACQMIGELFATSLN